MVIKLIYAGYKTGTVHAAWKDRKQVGARPRQRHAAVLQVEASAKRYVEVYAQARAAAHLSPTGSVQ